MGVIAMRLKRARLLSGMSQERLGLASGLDEMSASARMNRYETGARTPNLGLVERFAAVLDLPPSYFYAIDDMEADLLVRFHRLSMDKRAVLLDTLIWLEHETSAS